MQPIFQGSYERWKAPYDQGDEVRTTREWIERRWDLGRTIDYLETRPDIDASRLGYIGVSFGASIALPLVAVEPRLKAAVFCRAGFRDPDDADRRSRQLRTADHDSGADGERPVR